MIGLRLNERWPAQTRFFLLLSMAFNLFWGSGYLIYSGVANTGDWASAIAGLQPLWLWRLILVVLGIASYVWSTRLVAASLRSLLGQQGNHHVHRLLFIPYLAAGLSACFAALLYADDRIGSLSGAARETFFTNIGLLLILPWFKIEQTGESSNKMIVTRKLSWLMITTTAFIAFVAILGRGVGSHQ